MARRRANDWLADALSDCRERAALEMLLPRLATIDPLLPQLARDAFEGDDAAFMAWADCMEEQGRTNVASRVRALLAAGAPARLRAVAERLR